MRLRQHNMTRFNVERERWNVNIFFPSSLAKQHTTYIWILQVRCHSHSFRSLIDEVSSFLARHNFHAIFATVFIHIRSLLLSLSLRLDVIRTLYGAFVVGLLLTTARRVAETRPPPAKSSLNVCRVYMRCVAIEAVKSRESVWSEIIQQPLVRCSLWTATHISRQTQ